MLKAVASSAADATGVTAAAVLTANQFVVGDDGSRGIKTADVTITLPVAGLVSAPALALTGAVFTGGSATTTKPLILIEPAGTTSTGWTTAGTYLGINTAASGPRAIDVQIAGVTQWVVSASGNVAARNATSYTWTGRGILSSSAAGTINFGDADAATAVAQTIKAQSIVSGTADVAGQSWTMQGSLSTGSGASGSIVFKTGGTGAASTTVNTAITALTIAAGTTNNTNVGQPSIVLGAAAIATNATDGFLYLASSAGTPTGTPTTFTGRVPMCIDTTNSQLWLYLGGAWKQPKTPAAAALVTWQ